MSIDTSQPQGTPDGTPQNVPRGPPGAPIQSNDQSGAASTSSSSEQQIKNAQQEKQISDTIESMQEGKATAPPATQAKAFRDVTSNHPSLLTNTYAQSEESSGRTLDRKPPNKEDLNHLIDNGLGGGSGDVEDSGFPPGFYRVTGDDGTTNKVFDEGHAQLEKTNEPKGKGAVSGEETKADPNAPQVQDDPNAPKLQVNSFDFNVVHDPDNKTVTVTAQSTGSWGTGGSEYRVALEMTAQEIGDDARGAAVSGIEISLNMQFMVKNGIEDIQDQSIENAKDTFKAGRNDLIFETTGSLLSLGISGAGMGWSGDSMARSGLVNAMGSFAASASKTIGGVWSGDIKKNVEISKARLDTQSKVISQETQVIQELLKNIQAQLAARDHANDAAQQSLAKTGVVN